MKSFGPQQRSEIGCRGDQRTESDADCEARRGDIGEAVSRSVDERPMPCRDSGRRIEVPAAEGPTGNGDRHHVLSFEMKNAQADGACMTQL